MYTFVRVCTVLYLDNICLYTPTNQYFIFYLGLMVHTLLKVITDYNNMLHALFIDVHSYEVADSISPKLLLVAICKHNTSITLCI